MRLAVLIASLSVILALSVVTAACGSDNTAETPGASTTASADHGDEAAYQAFSAAVNKFAALSAFDVVYDVRVQNPQGSSFSAAVTITHKDDATRTAFDGTVEGAATHLLAIQDASGLTVCQDQQGQTCAHTTDAANSNPLASLDPIAILTSVLADQTLSVAAAPAQTFAGIAADCYTVTQSGHASTFCNDPASGVLLFALGESDESGNQKFTQSIAAKTLSTEVTAVDTSTPYPLSSPSAG